jgi:hypothetical protein
MGRKSSDQLAATSSLSDHWVISTTPDGLFHETMVENYRLAREGDQDAFLDVAFELIDYPERLREFFDFAVQDSRAGRIPKVFLEKALREMYVNNGDPMYQSFGVTLLIEMFSEFLPRPVQLSNLVPNSEYFQSVTLYRGMSDGTPVKGISWTENPAVAAFFAVKYKARSHVDPLVVRAEIPREAILFIPRGGLRMEEFEVLVNPRLIPRRGVFLENFSFTNAKQKPINTKKPPQASADLIERWKEVAYVFNSEHGDD